MRMSALWTLAAAGLVVLSPAVLAQTVAKDGFVRSTVPQQKSTGVFLTLTSAKGARLVGGSSPVAGMVEVHQMKMIGTTMTMGAIPFLELPAGQPVELKPGSYHLMLTDLKKQIKPGDTVTVTLMLQGADGKREPLELKLPAKALVEPKPMKK